MLQEFREAASSLRGKRKQSLNAQVDAVIRAKGTRLRAERRHGLLGGAWISIVSLDLSAVLISMNR